MEIRHIVNSALMLVLLCLGPIACDASGSSAGEGSRGSNNPASIQARKLLEAINSGDRAVMEAYRKDNFSPGWTEAPEADKGLYMHKEFGGFDLLEVDDDRPYALHGWVRARDSDAVLELVVETEKSAPHRINYLYLDWGNSPVKFRVQRLSEAAAIDAWRADTARRAQADKFSGVILLARDDQVLLREAYGFADREGKIANTVDTRFRTASTSKTFTAAAVLRLVQDGKLKLDDRVGKIVPALAGKPIAPATIHQLLTHTSGAGDFYGPRYDEHRKVLQTHDDFMRIFGGDPLLFAPGEKFEYHNLGFMYLGAAIEHVSGKSFYDYLQEAIFDPAGMKDTDTPPVDVDMRGRAKGYFRPPGEREWIPAGQHLEYRADGAGGAWSTADDIRRFLAALRAQRILDRKFTRLMFEPKTEAWQGHKYGYGIWVDEYPGGGQWIGGIGGEKGSSSEAWFNPASGYQVIVLSNFDFGAAKNVSEFVRARLPVPVR
ncbi:MAG TPA: serine hydrolase domain-containing protein [Steroidobacteraceae bacterium]